jgi:hypothetical protein
MQFRLQTLMAAVAVSAVLMAAITWPPALPATFGIAGAVTAHLIRLKSEQFEVGMVGVGFGLGGLIGIMGYEVNGRLFWETREWAAASLIPAIAITMVVLGLHHARHRRLRERQGSKSC